ncbi:MAG: hypothetical protein HS115_09925 [Spirochaetales bacterium]|nr:hypothetical protein [Spirochaetales bacterium]
MRLACLALLPIAFCSSPPVAETGRKGLEAQLNQNVQLTGQMSSHIMQHPISGPADHIHYMDYDGVQIVLYSDKPIHCQEKIIATGKLQRVDLGGRPGRKTSYSGYRLDVMDFICP